MAGGGMRIIIFFLGFFLAVILLVAFNVIVACYTEMRGDENRVTR